MSAETAVNTVEGRAASAGQAAFKSKDDCRALLPASSATTDDRSVGKARCCDTCNGMGETRAELASTPPQSSSVAATCAASSQTGAGSAQPRPNTSGSPCGTGDLANTRATVPQPPSSGTGSSVSVTEELHDAESDPLSPHSTNNAAPHNATRRLGTSIWQSVGGQSAAPRQLLPTRSFSDSNLHMLDDGHVALIRDAQEGERPARHRRVSWLLRPFGKQEGGKLSPRGSPTSDIVRPPPKTSKQGFSSLQSFEEAPGTSYLRGFGPPPSLVEISGSPSAPILLAARDNVGQTILSPHVARQLPVNNLDQPIEFETDLFKGRLALLARGLRDAPNNAFSGKARKTHIIVQGKFKQSLRMGQVLTGQEFFAPAQGLPPKWLVDCVLMSLLRAYDSTMHIESPHVRPVALVPLVTAAQAIHVSTDDASEHLMLNATEDMRALGPAFAAADGSPLTMVQRRRVAAAKLDELVFDTKHTWTFHIWQHFVDFSTYELAVGPGFDLARHLAGQPLQVAAKVLDGGYLWCLDVWHTKLLGER